MLTFILYGNQSVAAPATIVIVECTRERSFFDVDGFVWRIRGPFTHSCSNIPVAIASKCLMLAFYDVRSVFYLQCRFTLIIGICLYRFVVYSCRFTATFSAPTLLLLRLTASRPSVLLLPNICYVEVLLSMLERTYTSIYICLHIPYMLWFAHSCW